MPQIISTKEEFEKITSQAAITLVHFSANFAEQCKQIDNLFDILSKQDESSSVKFTKCDAEALSEISLKYKIEAVPSILIFYEGQQVDRIDGSDPKIITDKINAFVGKEPIKERLEKLINKSKVMLFMKGSKTQPRCGFSNKIVEILNTIGVEYETFDILTDEIVRQTLKAYSKWPTYPQLYIKGELVGGLDIVKEMLASGELLQMLNS